MTPSVPEKLLDAGISITDTFEPGDLGRLIEIHGIQNFQDYGFSSIHEAYCAQIAIDFMLNPNPGRSKAWLAKKDRGVVGSVLICELPDNIAQLRLLFADKSVRGSGLGRWLTEDSVQYCREAGFKKVVLWTVDGLSRAISIYQSLGFKLTEERTQYVWGRESRELRFDLDLTDESI